MDGCSQLSVWPRAPEILPNLYVTKYTFWKQILIRVGNYKIFSRVKGKEEMKIGAKKEMELGLTLQPSG